MKKNVLLVLILIFAALMFTACAGDNASDSTSTTPTTPAIPTTPANQPQHNELVTNESPPLVGTGSASFTPVGSLVFVEHTNGLDDGMSRLFASMEARGQCFYEMITPDSVVLIKINAQWDQRGGTNTDLIARTIEAILAHPGDFTGEIIVADNGQAQFGSRGQGGDLDWPLANSACREQSTLDVIRSFQARGYRVTGVLWDEFTTVRVNEFSYGDYTDGFIVEDEIRNTGLEITYPKFTTEFGTHVSFREGIWDSQSETYDHGRLKIINMPVLKSHMLLQQTGAVKNYMGVVSDRLTGRRAHNSVATGGMGTQMVYSRMPVLNILDMIWVGPDRGPASSFNSAVEINKVAASTDPVALDVWATRYVLIPEAERVPGGRAVAMNPQGTEPGTFGHWLRLSLNEMVAAGYNFTMDESEIFAIIGGEGELPPAEDIALPELTEPEEPTELTEPAISVEIGIRLVIDELAYTVNGVTTQGDAAPFIDPIYNRTMVPLRLIAENLGAQVNWVSETRTVIIETNGRMFTLQVDTPLPGGMGQPVIVDGLTFVPIAYVAQTLGADVRWDGVNRAVYIQQ